MPTSSLLVLNYRVEDVKSNGGNQHDGKHATSLSLPFRDPTLNWLTRFLHSRHGGRGTLACTCTLISARHTRSVCREVANRSVSRQGERVRSSDNSYKIAASRRYQKLAEVYWALALGEKTFYMCGRKRRLTNA